MLDEYFKNSVDGIPLLFRIWSPEVAGIEKMNSQAPDHAVQSPLVCLVHGLGEHSGRYVHLAKYFNDLGIAAAGFDLRGHGRSQGKRGHAPNIELLMSDIQTLVDEATSRFPGSPLFIYGHSLGGLLTLNYLLRCRPNVAGVVLSAPGLRTPLVEQKAKRLFVQLLGGIFPRLTIPTGLDPQALSHDPSLVAAYRADALVHDKGTLSMGRIALIAIDYVFENVHELDCPVLLMHGTADPLVYPRGSEELATLCRSCVELKTWPGFYHELHNEPGWQDVLAYVTGWIRTNSQ